MSTRPVTLVISNIAWDFVWQRHQTLASLFAQDSDVVFCEVPGIRRVGWRDTGRLIGRLCALGRKRATGAALPSNLCVTRPFVLPATNRWFHAINRRLLARYVRQDAALAGGVALILNYSPSRSALELIERVPHCRLVYDCTDDWLAVRGIPECLPEDEQALLAKADLTLVPSRALMDRKAPFARRIECVPHGALVERFLVEPKASPADAALTLLYYGHLHAQHLDFVTIEMIAKAKPAWRIVLVGPVKTPYAFPANVGLAGQQPHAMLRDFVRAADVLILPYTLNEYTRAVLPAKIYECLATGRPIVATPLPELVTDFSEYLTFANRGEWPEKIETALEANSPAACTARIELANANTWERRYSRIRDLLARLDY